MATGTSQVGMNIQYNRERITIYARKEEKVGSVIARAVKELKLSEGNRFTLLHQGNRIRDDVPVEVAVANKTTVLFLQKTSEDQIRSTLELRLENNARKNSKYGFCKTCGYLCQTRPIYTCNLCRKVDFFDEESLLQMSGVCSNCDNTKPSVQYICRACEDENSTVPFLPQIRDNIHNKPCMKCSEKEERVLLFTCQSRHSMCIECFVSMCYMKLSCGEFKNFETGYSVACPGPGADCNKSPIVDPHHFYVVDNAKDFYAKFKELSFKEWLPPGENIICDQCQVEIDLSSGKEVPVTQPATDDPQATVPGSAWMFWKKFFSRPQSQPQPAPPMMRKQVACFKCNRQFCCICKHLWHEGNCVQLSEEAERQAKEFTIDPEQARLSCWPAT